jgi:hypothetical protein
MLKVFFFFKKSFLGEMGTHKLGSKLGVKLNLIISNPHHTLKVFFFKKKKRSYWVKWVVTN